MSRTVILPHRWRTGPDDAHDAEAIAGILETPPVPHRADGVAIVARIGTREVLPFLVALKSLHGRLGRGRPVILDNGTLDGADRTILAFHCGDPEILPPRAVSLGGFPSAGDWEPWLAAFDRRRGEYWLLLDPLAVVVESVPQIEQALAANRSLSTGPGLAGLAAGGPGRPDPEALFRKLGDRSRPASAAAHLLMERETAPVELTGCGIAHFGPEGADAHARASKAAIEALA